MSDLSMFVEPSITFGLGGIVTYFGWAFIKWLRNRMENGYIKLEVKSSTVDELKQTIEELKSEKSKLEVQNKLLETDVDRLSKLKCNFKHCDEDAEKGCKYVILLEELKRQKQK